MESKKINQLATELSPALDDLTIIGDPTTGISKKITLSQMASLFTGTVEEYANLAAFPLVGAADTIYIALDTNVLYRWNGSAYVELSPNIISNLVFGDANGFDGTISLVGSTATLTITTALTLGSLPFIGASGALTQDNANLFWDNTNKWLGIGTNAPTTPLDVFGSGIIARVNGTSTNNGFLGFASAGTNKWSVGNVQSDHRFRIFSEANTSELVSILQTGEFGIGIANPTTKLHLDGGATALIANLDANVSVAKSISFRSDNSNRINLEVSGTESGSNAGANFFIRRYSDAGALIDTPFQITRSTGLITLATALLATSATFANSINLSKASQSSAGFYIGDSGSTSSSSLFVKTGSLNSSFSSGFGVNGTYLGGLSTIRLHAIGTQTAGGYASSIIFVLDNDGVEREHGLFLSDGRTQFNGSASASSFIPLSATIPTNGMYLSGTNTLDFATNSTNRLSISSGGVSTFSGPIIGTTGNFSASATNPLAITNTGGREWFNVNTTLDGGFSTFRSSGTVRGYIGNGGGISGASESSFGMRSESDLILMSGGNNIRATITSVGNVGIGTSTPQLNANGGTFLTVQGTNASGWLELATTSTSDGNGGLISFNNTNIAGSDKRVASIYGLRDGANNSAYIGFSTNNAGSTAERMRIPSNGGVQSTPAVGSNAFIAIVSGTSIAYLSSLASTSDLSGYWQVAGNLAGSITHPTNTSTNYNTSSDYRLKENIKPLSNGLESILKLKPVTGNYINDETKMNMPMFLAHEVKEVVPVAVTGEKDAMKIDKITGKEIMDIQQLDASKLIPHMVKAIQELTARIIQLENN